MFTQISLTGVAWILAGLISHTLAFQMVRSALGRKNVILKRFGWFFAVLGFAFFSFASSLFTTDPRILNIALITGLELLVFGAIFIADVSWIIRWNKVLPRWFFPAVLASGGAVLGYILITQAPQPAPVHFGIFSVMDWNLTIAAFFTSVAFPLFAFFITGAALIHKSKLLEGNARKRGLILGYSFILAPFFGYFTSAPFLPPIVLLLFTIGELAVFVVLLFAVFKYKPAEQIRRHIEEPTQSAHPTTMPK